VIRDGSDGASAAVAIGAFPASAHAVAAPVGATATAAGRRAVAGAMAFVSGFAALGYELVWLRRLGHLWGGSAIPEMLLTTCFVVGLGVGGALLAKRLSRFGRPLAHLVAVEIAIGIFGLAFERLLTALWTLHANLIGADAASGVRWAAALGATAAAVLVPASLMGTTTLLLCRWIESEDAADATPAGGLLFGANTVGASCGCLVTGFVLLPRLGLDVSGWAFAGANALVAGAAFVQSRRSRAVASLVDAPRVAAPARKTAARPLVAAAVLGFLGMGLEYGWIRELVLVLGGSVYAFQSVLFVLLCGLGVGGVCGARLVRRRGADAAAFLLVAVVVLGGAVGQSGVSWLASTLGAVAALRTSTLGNLAVSVGASSLVVLPASIGMGGLFVAALALARGAGDESDALRRVSFANCLGGAAAGWIVMFQGFPVVGVENTIAALLAGFAAVRAFLLRDGPPRRREAFLVCVGAAVVAVAARTTIDSRLLRMGQFMYGPAARVEAETAKPLFLEDGRSCSVLVSRAADDNVTFRVNGKVDGGLRDMDTQMGSVALSLCLRPLARDVLVVGYGTGTSSHVAALWPGTRVTCCEIEPAVIAGAKWFDAASHGDVSASKVNVVEDDGRRFLQGTDATYDVVVSEPSNPWLAGATNLFTREFYATVASRLNPRGVFVQWVQTYSFGPDDYRNVLATVRSVFADAVVVRINGGDTMAIACKDDSVLPPAGFASLAQERIDATPAIRRDLVRYFGTSSVRRLIAGRCILGRDDVDAFCGSSATVVTDRNLRLEYDTPLRVFGGYAASNVVKPMLLDAVSGRWIERVHRALGESADGRDGLLELWDACFLARSRRGMSITSSAWTAIAPDDVRALVRRAMSADVAPADVGKIAGAALAVSRAEALRLAIVLRDQKRTAESIEVLKVMVATNPRDGEAAYDLSLAYAGEGRTDEATTALATAVRADPLHPLRAEASKAIELSR